MHLSLPLEISSKVERKRSELGVPNICSDKRMRDCLNHEWKLGNDLMLAIKFN